jgi:hypothetical protein
VNAAGLTLPPAAGAASDAAVAFAAGLIDRSGKAPVIEAALAHRTGRPRPLPVRAVLTALLCLALDDRPLFLTEVTRLLFCQISGTSVKAAEPGGPHRPHQADDPRPGRSCPRPAGSVPQRATRVQHLGPDRRRTRGV